MDFTVRIWPAEPESGYVVQCVELPSAISQGETEDEALENICDAIAGLLELMADDAASQPGELRRVNVAA